MNENAIFMNLVLQSKVKGEAFNLLICVDLHFGGIFIFLKVFDDIREPDGQTIIPAITQL